MSDLRSKLGDPTSLTLSRTIAHAAVQPLTKAARANLQAVPDDSHSNLEWSSARGMFLTHPLGAGAAHCQVGLGLAPLRLVILSDGDEIDTLALAGQTTARALDWVDEALQDIELAPASPVALPYDLPGDVVEIDRFGEDSADLAHLAAWFSLAAGSLSDFAAANAALDPGPSPVRCWPHHFDIATYVQLEPGDFETAKGIGVGLSPGDESYDEPYFYVNPWPHLPVASLPEPIAPGHWHTKGFVGSIATGQEILTGEDPAKTTAQFLRGSFSTGRAGLGI
ncbi:MAG: hypothetical protein QNJ16_08200 [Rhodobacter sp.]|nr:hypothetical protein [Rhodobacter sp.]